MNIQIDTKCCMNCNGNCAKCVNLLPMCKRYGEIPREKLREDYSSTSAEDDYKDASYPTIKEMIDIWYPKYAQLQFAKTTTANHIGSPRPNAVKVNRSLCRSSAKFMEISLDEPISAITRKRLLSLIRKYEELKVRKLNGEDVKVPAEQTISHYLYCWKNITAKWFHEAVEFDGAIRLPDIQIPTFKMQEKAAWKKPSKKQEVLFKHTFFDKLAEKKDIDWAMAIFMRATGCRNRDVDNAKWENFKIIDGRCFYVYTDNKTQKTAAHPISNELLDNLLSWKKTFYSPSSPNIHFKNWRQDDPYVFGGKYDEKTNTWSCTSHSSIWRRLNKLIKSSGICDLRNDKKGMYQLRALRGQEIYEANGQFAMTYGLHNSAKVANHYSQFDLNKITAAI